MKFQLKEILAVCLASGAITCAAGPVSGLGTWEATLLGRDINGRAVEATSSDSVFLFDTELNITWLRDANAMRWSWNGSPQGDAKEWAQSLSVGSFGGWRLPKSDRGCVGYYCEGSEMGHLWHSSLGNSHDAPHLPLNTGAFLNVQVEGFYWTGDPNDFGGMAQYFNFGNGMQQDAGSLNHGFALAVRTGDVLVQTVPEPQALALTVFGLIGLTIARRRINQ